MSGVGAMRDEKAAGVAKGHIVVAQMNTNDYIWQGAGFSEDDARAALLSAWGLHRARVVSLNPALAATLPEPAQMTQHFRITYTAYAAGAGYRDGEQLV
jgi:hypothetical protein